LSFSVCYTEIQKVYELKTVTWNFVLRPALLDELLDALDDVLVVLDRPDRALRDGRHLGLRNGRLYLVQR
jgi:hypothetical protein